MKKLLREAVYLYQRFKDILFTKRCLCCGTLVDVFSDCLFCPACEKTAVRTGDLCPQFYGADFLSLYAYSGAVREAVHAFKFQNDERGGIYLAEELARGLEPYRSGYDLVVCVPYYRLKKGRRYHAAEFLAQKAAKMLDLPFDAKALVKTRPAASQTRQKSRRARFANVRGVYRVQKNRTARLRGKKVILIDDISTTGATLSVCIEALFAAGVSGVLAAVVAKTQLGVAGTGLPVCPNVSESKKTFRYQRKERANGKGQE